MDLLLNSGAHIDMSNRSSQRPVDMLATIPECTVQPLRFMSLRCLAATAVARAGLPYKQEVPAMLEDFIEAHK